MGNAKALAVAKLTLLLKNIWKDGGEYGVDKKKLNSIS